MWGVCENYSSNAVEQMFAMWKAYLFGAYTSKMKGMYTSPSGHIVDCSEFIWDI